MFTGIIEEVGTLRSVQRGAHSAVLTIGASRVLSDLKIGDSVAVNGVCLTATRLLPDGFTAQIAQVLGKREGTVRSLLNRGREKLRQIWKEGADGTL